MLVCPPPLPQEEINMTEGKQSGFAVMELAIILVLLAAVAGVGYAVWNRQQNNTNVPTHNLTFSAYKSPPTSVPTAPTITNAADLNAALQALNRTSINSNTTDSNQLYAQASGF